MDTDGIDLAVLYPTSMLGLQSIADEEFARVQARAYNDWASDHTQEGEGRLFAAGAVPPMNDEDGVAAVAAEIRRVAEKPGMVSRCSCVRTRRSTGGRSTTRSTTRCGRPPPRPVSCSRSTRS